VPRAALENGALREAEQALTGLSGVQQVRPNPLASSLVVLYDRARVDAPAVLAALARAGLRLAEPSPVEVSVLEDGSALGRSVQDFFGNFDERVARLTGGTADLRTLVPLGLAALAVREIMAGRVAAAPWYTLAWWAFDAFYKLHTQRVEVRRADE
jgi:hypothetical protein